MGGDKQTVRLFIAFALKEEAKREIFSLYRSLSQERQIKWVEKENLHATIVFLGSTPVKKVEKIKRILDRIPLPQPSPILIDELGGFPSLSRPRVIWIGPSHTPPWTSEVFQRITGALKQGHIAFDAKPKFVFHITLGRVRRPSPRLAEITSRIEAPEIELLCDEICLFQSHLSRSGPVYEVIHSRKMP